MKAELRALLLTHAPLIAAVSRRVDWDVLPQAGALPAVALHQISGPRSYTMKGRVGLTPYRIQMVVWAGDRDSREVAYLALLGALDRSPTAPFQALFIDDDGTDSAAAPGPNAAGSARFFSQRLDVIAWTTES